MMRYRLLTLLLPFALMTTAVGEEEASSAGKRAVPGIPEFSADYELRRNNIRAARLTRTLECENGECRFNSQGRTVGFADLLLRGRINEYTRFRFDGEAIEPRDYSYRQRARGDNDEYVRLFFHPGTGRVSSRGDEEWQVTVEGEVMDELLSQLRLMLAVRGGESEMEFNVVDGVGDLDAYRFEVVGEERIETDAGTFDTVKVKRVRGSAKRITEMWFAPELEYIPLVVRHERVDRESYTATLVELKKEPRVYKPGE